MTILSLDVRRISRRMPIVSSVLPECSAAYCVCLKFFGYVCITEDGMLALPSCHTTYQHIHKKQSRTHHAHRIDKLGMVAELLERGNAAQGRGGAGRCVALNEVAHCARAAKLFVELALQIAQPAEHDILICSTQV